MGKYELKKKERKYSILTCSATKREKNKATVTENEKRSTSKGTGKVSMLDTLLELERLRRR